MNPYALLGGIGAAVALAIGSYFYGHHEGANAVQAQFDSFKEKQATASAGQIASNVAALAFQQTMYGLQIAAIQKDHSDEVQAIQKRADDALASSNYYAGQLRKFLSASAGRKQPAVSGTAASATGANAASPGGQYDGVQRLNFWLVGRFTVADTVAAKFNEAVAVIAKDREICNGSLPGVTP
jgi:hypothetical protein